MLSNLPMVIEIREEIPILGTLISPCRRLKHDLFLAEGRLRATSIYLPCSNQSLVVLHVEASSGRGEVLEGWESGTTPILPKTILYSVRRLVSCLIIQSSLVVD